MTADELSKIVAAQSGVIAALVGLLIEQKILRPEDIHARLQKVLDASAVDDKVATQIVVATLMRAIALKHGN